MRLLSNVSSFSSPCSCSPLSELGERERESSSSSRCRPSGTFSPIANSLCGSLNVQSSCSWLQITERSGKHTFLLRNQISGTSNLRIAGDSFPYSSFQSTPAIPLSTCSKASQLFQISPGNGRVVNMAATRRLRQLDEGALTQPGSRQFKKSSSLWCGCPSCGRRSLLTSLGGALLSGIGDENLPAAQVVDSNADAIREAVHPARPDWYEELYAKLMDTAMRSYEAQIAGYKKQLFARLDDNVKTVLELGIGTGPNLPFYGGRPSIQKVIGVDPNAKMARYAEAAASRVGEGLPLDDSSVDAVVCTLVLCSISNVSSTLKEVQRVLRPGGTFLFVEHVAAPEGGALRFWQNLLDPVQQLVADGCHLTRDTLGLIQGAHFASLDAQNVTVEGAFLMGPHVLGIATTP